MWVELTIKCLLGKFIVDGQPGLEGIKHLFFIRGLFLFRPRHLYGQLKSNIFLDPRQRIGGFKQGLIGIAGFHGVHILIYQ